MLSTRGSLNGCSPIYGRGPRDGPAKGAAIVTVAQDPNLNVEERLRLDEQALAELRQIGERRTFPPGSQLTSQGAVEKLFYVIESGQAAVLRRDEDGQERSLGTLGPQQYFGELALLDDQPRFATVQAVSEVTVHEVDADGFTMLMQTNPSLAMNITRTVLASMRQLDRRTINRLHSKNEQLARAYDELQAAQAQIVEKERLEHELDLAAEAQRRLLPGGLPRLDDFSFAAYLRSARSVGGDLYDVRILDDEHIGILIADVADKGMHAALMMAVSRALFYEASRRDLSPSAVALAVHRGLIALGSSADDYSDTFVTAFYGVLHRPSRTLTYVRAAHDRPLLVHAGTEPEFLAGNGRFLGMIDELELQEYVHPLAPGDALVLFSDGLPDALDAAGNHYGLERLQEQASTCAGLSAEDLLEVILGDVSRWIGETPLFDDLSILVVKSEVAN